MKNIFCLILVTASLAYAGEKQQPVTRHIIENNVDEGTEYRTSTEAAGHSIEHWVYYAHSIPDKKPIEDPKAAKEAYKRLKKQYDDEQDASISLVNSSS